MEKRILIIGQAPPAVKQDLPYDTTMLYDMLEWAGIDKNKAQSIFSFNAMTDKFPGYNANGGHAVPTKQEMRAYYTTVLQHEIKNSPGVIVLGNVAASALKELGFNHANTLHLIHPSKRNAARIKASRNEITQKLTAFLSLCIK